MDCHFFIYAMCGVLLSSAHLQKLGVNLEF